MNYPRIMRIDFPIAPTKPEERVLIHFRLKSGDKGAYETVEINRNYPGTHCMYGLADRIIGKRGPTVLGKQIEARCDAVRLFLRGLDCVYKADR